MKSVWTMGEMIVEIMRPRAEMPHSKPDVYMGPYASGAPAIMISSAARMGAKAGIIGGVGQDAHGQMIVDRLEGCGVDCSKVLRSADKSTGNAFVMYHDDGSREFIFHIGGTAATQCGVPDLSDVAEPGYFHLMGCSLTADKDYCARILETAEAFRAKGAKFSFDPNIRPELLKDGDFKSIIGPFLKNCSVLLPGVSELKMIAGKDTVEEAVEALFENEVLEVIALKIGSKGCKVYTRDAVQVIPACVVEEKDATGAGDCFDGAFIAALLAGEDVYTAARWGNAAGALNAAAFGPLEGDISPATVAQMLKDNQQ